MNTALVKIAVGTPDNSWAKRFVAALEEKRNSGYPLTYDVVSMHRKDWLEKLRPYDVVIWKSASMGVEHSLRFKEKIYVIEKFLRKLVIPNFDSIWHFESKIAQHYLFTLEKIPIPRTVVTFDFHEAQHLKDETYPLVFKKSEGAGSKNVRLVESRHAAKKLIAEAFSSQIYREARSRGWRWPQIALRSFWKPWFWRWLLGRRWKNLSPGYLYWQEFLKGNPADLRITAIGDCYAYGFWRHNRPHDFRASGSGLLDYHRPIPEECVRYCLACNQRLNFDSMAYDILFQEGRFAITEISYGYVDRCLERVSGHFELSEAGNLSFVPGHVWPQNLWVDWALIRWERSRKRS